MFPLIPVALTSGLLTAAVATLQKHKPQALRRTLLTALAEPAALPTQQLQAQAWQAVTARLTAFDDRYQHFFQTRLNPLLINPARREQLVIIQK